MQRLGWMVALVVIAVACGTAGDMVGEMLDSGVPDAGAEMPGDGTSMQYVGNSTQTFGGDPRTLDEDGIPVRDDLGNEVHRGRFEEYAACQETFGPGHRNCTTAEIQYTTKIPQLEGKAWYGLGGGCGDDDGARRSAVSATGAFSQERCFYRDTRAVDLPIACCGPK